MEKESMTPEKNISNTPINLLNIIASHMYSPNKVRLDSNKTNCVDSSAFKFIASYSTPPSRFFKVRNPFDAALANRLHLPISSPSVFEKLPTPKEKFPWTIEEISNLNPAPIEENECNQFDQPEDPEIEETAHKNIEKYFKEEKQIVPSPWDESKSHPVLLPKDSTPTRGSLKSDKLLVDMKDGICQTVLSLPFTLPDKIETVLRPYFTFTENQQQSDDENLMNQSFCRRLFHNESVESETSNNSTILDALPPFQSPYLERHQETSRFDKDFNRHHLLESPLESPVLNASLASQKGRCSKITSIHQSTPTPSPQSAKDEPFETLEESPLSPISKNIELSKPTFVDPVTSPYGEDMKMDEISINATPVNTSRRSIKRLEFSNEICSDYVPDSENLPDQSMNLLSATGTSLLAVEEDCTYSSVNWDIENRSISNINQSKIIKNMDIKTDNLIADCCLVPHKNIINQNTSLMDISNCITSPPRRRQRLHSFVKRYSEDNFDDHEKENIPCLQSKRNRLRRCFSDVNFGSNINMCNIRYSRRNYYSADNYHYTIQRKSSSTAVNPNMDDDSIIQDRSLIDSDRDNNSHLYFETEEIVLNENTQDTGYNSNTGETPIVFSNANIVNIGSSSSNDKESNLELTSFTPSSKISSINIFF